MHAVNITDTDAWTCPRCGETTRGSKQHRRTQQGIHARRHDVTRASLTAEARELSESAAPTSLVIPAAPATRRRVR